MAMRIKLRQVEGFLAAADLLSFSRAADKIGMTQPAFSQLIRDLENALDVKLFDRSTRRVRITEVGLLLRDQMRRGLLEIDNACNNARAITRLERGQLTLAVLPSLALGFVTEALTGFHKTHPGFTSGCKRPARHTLPICCPGTRWILRFARTSKATMHCSSNTWSPYCPRSMRWPGARRWVGASWPMSP
jgi:hypothetical protein